MNNIVSIALSYNYWIFLNLAIFQFLFLGALAESTATPRGMICSQLHLQ